jgi:hypothetical protein
MSSDWQPTADERIQVRPVYGTAETLPLRAVQADAWKKCAATAPVRKMLPVFGLGFVAGYQTRIRRVTEPKPDQVRCGACQKCFKATKTGAPWGHKCEPSEAGWLLLAGLVLTPEMAMRRGCDELYPEAGPHQTVWDVGDGKKKVA